MAIAGAAVFSDRLFAAPLKKTRLAGIQLYSIRADMGKDPMATLKMLADMGYKHVEHANYIPTVSFMDGLQQNSEKCWMILV